MAELQIADEEVITDLQHLVGEMEQALTSIAQQTEEYRLGRPDYDDRLDRVYETARDILDFLYREKSWGYYV